MSAVISRAEFSKTAILLLLSLQGLVPLHAAPVTADPNAKINQMPVQPSIKLQPAKVLNPTPTKIPVPLQNIKQVPLKPVIIPGILNPAPPRPVAAGSEPRPVSDAPRPDRTPAAESMAPSTDGGPGYDSSPGYNSGSPQNYDSGGGYASPGTYSPEYGNEYNQQPGYSEQPQQPFRGVGGSLMDQQQFEFKPLEELISSTQQVTQVDQTYEPGQLLVATISMDEAKRLQKAVASAGYRPKSRTSLLQLGFVLTTFRVPAGVSVPDAVVQFKEAFPGFLVNANTRYIPLSSSVNKKDYAKSLINWKSEYSKCAKIKRIGLLDGQVDTNKPYLAEANIQTSSSLPAGVAKKTSDHADAIANLLVGNEHGLLSNAELLAVNVFRNTDGKPETTTAWILEAINSLLEQNVTLINMSFGGARDELLAYAVKTLFEKQVLITAAAGNTGPGGQPVYPAAYPEVIAVTAVDSRRKIYRKANRGDYIDIAAPGVDIWSVSSNKGQYYTGTSFAVPFVTATLSVLRGLYPDESAAQIKSRLSKFVSDVGEEGKDPVFGWGVLNLKGICKN